MLLEGKSIVVTGGNTGIGKAIVLAAAAKGANVVVDYVMHPKYTAEVTAAAGRAGGCAVGVEADVSRTDDLRQLIQIAVAEFGGRVAEEYLRHGVVVGGDGPGGEPPGTLATSSVNCAGPSAACSMTMRVSS
jgi:NAD(P)-dependent dehydrogenase (short-subunit alcohol dehydrogenase family)